VLVDDAIIGIENILRRLAENAKLPEPRGRLGVIRNATLEVRGPVVYATLVVIIIFLPELFSSSVQGHFVGALALAFILAVLASLGVALTATPALVALMLKTRTAHADQGWIQRLKQGQDRTVSRVYRGLRLVLPVGALIPSGVGLYLDNAAFATGQYVVCSPEGCLVELSVDENQLNAMRKAKTLSIVFKTPAPPTPENSQATQNIQLPLSTEGLAAALDGNALDPQTIVDEQKKLQEQLQKAADEARKALNANPAPAQ